ncbi:hypothetical protein HN803_05245 [candidate division WWE3 bacterium]|jgi:hypothetical protein|nr:hypothetical protein [candidate division WWE3 bacterium]
MTFKERLQEKTQLTQEQFLERFKPPGIEHYVYDKAIFGSFKVKSYYARSREKVTRIAEHFISRLNRKIHGNRHIRYNVSLQIICVIEPSGSDNFHFHCLFLLPDEIRALELFENKIRDSFLELDNVVKSRSNKEPNLKRVESNLDFQRAYSYCFKDLNKMYPYNSECVHFTFVRT